MILYFSGTGNSRYAAQLIGTAIGDEIVSINDLIKKSNKEKVNSDKPFVFVCPTYAWRLPRVVETFLNDTQFSGNNKAYFILTCGSDIGNTAMYVKKICNAKGIECQGIATVIMPDNYIVMYNTPNKEQSEKIIKKADKALNKISDIIKNQQLLPEEKYKFGDKIKSSMINTMFYSFFVNANGFYSTKDCINCGQCKKLCPLNNIEIVNAKPKWSINCTHCMACISGCPTKAIEYKNKTKDRHRYYKESYHSE